MAEESSKPEEKKAPSAFISYSHDSDKHKAWVRSLDSQLQDEGIDTILDQWDLDIGDNIPTFIENAITETDFTIIVCTPKYKKKAKSKKGWAAVECFVITNKLCTNLGENVKNSKFIPVLRSGTIETSLPTYFEASLAANLTGDDAFNSSDYQRLVKKILGNQTRRPAQNKELENRLWKLVSQEKYKEIMKIGEDAVDPIIKIAKDGDQISRRNALTALSKLNKNKAVEPLIEALGDKEEIVYNRAIDTLANYRDEQLVKRLLEVLGDKDPEVGAGAAKALGKIGSLETIKPLVEALCNGEEGEIRGAAAEALGTIGDSSSREPLYRALEDKSFHVRFMAAAALGKMGDNRGVGILLEALESDVSIIRIKAAQTFFEIGDPI